MTATSTDMKPRLMLPRIIFFSRGFICSLQSAIQGNTAKKRSAKTHDAVGWESAIRRIDKGYAGARTAKYNRNGKLGQVAIPSLDGAVPQVRKRGALHPETKDARYRSTH
jgi:hypothetical protein